MNASDAKKVLESLKELVPDPETDFGPSYGAAVAAKKAAIRIMQREVGQQSYVVTWQVEVIADSAREAAQEALKIQQAGTMTTFKVSIGLDCTTFFEVEHEKWKRLKRSSCGCP